MAQLRRLWRVYLRNLDEHPVLVKCATSCSTFGATDAIAQSRERQKAAQCLDPASTPPRHDFARTARCATFGLYLGR